MTQSQFEKEYEDAVNCSDFKRAMEICNRYLEIDSRSPSAFRKRASLRAREFDFIQAISDITKAIEFVPDDASFYFFRGWWQLEMGNFEEAVADQTKAIELGDKFGSHYHDESAFCFRAVALLHLKRFHDALSDCERVRSDFLVYLRSLGRITTEDIISNAKKGILPSSPR